MLFRIIKAGAINFFRNAWLGIAAIAVMVITLTIVLFSLLTSATFNNTIEQIRQKIDISVYLHDDVAEPQREALLATLRNRSDVASLTYLSKDDALARYQLQNAGNTELLSAVTATDNPLPATILIKPRDLNDIPQILLYLNQDDVIVLQSDEPLGSEDRREAIEKITHATNVLQRAGVIAVAVFALVSMLIIFNTIQMAIFNRRDELTIMRLLGASTSYIRGPFVVETIIYGIVSALLSILLIHALFVTAKSALEATSLGLLDINYSSHYFYDHFWALLGIQMGVGILIGAVSSTIATRRYLKFKTTK